MPTHDNPQTDPYLWEPQPEAAAFMNQLLDEFLQANAWTSDFAARLSDETGTRLIDWVDHLAMPARESLQDKLIDVGFAEQRADGRAIWQHPGGLFPPLRLHEGMTRGLALRVESVADFLSAHGLDARTSIVGSPLAALRRALVNSESDTRLWVVERHGFPGWEPPELGATEAQAVLQHAEAFKLRQRDYQNAADGFAHARQLIAAATADLGTDRTCDLFFAAERDFWQTRNRAARIQKARQDALGVGWANHDHHTYRCSRECFAQLIDVFEQLGCHCRERFYAGAEAGWGAQVLEQPACRIVIFADVDLTPDEVSGDFAHAGLPARRQMGTVGLWCRLHGEAFLQAGMHHLECQYDFDRARAQLQKEGVGSMPPFTDFDYLKQAFTEGEIWPVDEARLEAALRDGLITAEQAEQFRRDGALGSHLEILQRDDGYKGFNQTGVSDIIRRTDPRR